MNDLDKAIQERVLVGMVNLPIISVYKLEKLKFMMLKSHQYDYENILNKRFPK